MPCGAVLTVHSVNFQIERRTHDRHAALPWIRCAERHLLQTGALEEQMTYTTRWKILHALDAALQNPRLSDGYWNDLAYLRERLLRRMGLQ